MGEIRLLDCTLRDGGYLNDWKFGHDNIVTIYERLVSAKVDIIEVGFLDERRMYDFDRSILPDTDSVKQTYGDLDRGQSMIVAMIDYGTCGIDRVQECADCYLDGIRVIFKKDKMRGAIAFCGELKEKGYKVFVQAVSITSYNDAEFAELIDMVNELEPYAFSLVDTYGLLHKEQLAHYFTMADKRLKQNIGLGYHAHNNFQLAYANCIEVLESKIDRTLIVDGTLYGMGKSAGNAPIELLAKYMNEHCGKQYRIHQLLEVIDVTILEIYRKVTWGYNFKFYLSAANDCHPNYVTYLQSKSKLSVKSICRILDRIEPEKKLLYDEAYIEKLYLDYQSIECDDTAARTQLADIFAEQKVLILGPGNNVNLQRDRIVRYMEQENPVVISINFVPHNIPVRYLFLSNSKRYVQLATALSRNGGSMKIIATSNITSASQDFSYVLNYGELLDMEAEIQDNPLLMLLKLLADCRVRSVALAGFDGYDRARTSNYVNANMEYTFTKEKAHEINEDVRRGLARAALSQKITFITDSFYIEGCEK